MNKYSLKKEFKLSEENAIDQIMILLDRYDIDIDSKSDEIKEGETQSTKEAFETTIDKIVRFIRIGQVEVFEEDNNVKVRLNIQNSSENATIKELVFGELRGKDHIAMPKNGNEYKRMISLLDSMCETNGGGDALKQLRSSDLTAAEALSLLFL